MYQYVLAIHILGAFLTAFLIVINFIKPKFTKTIWFMGFLQIFSGLGLSVISNLSFGKSCVRIGIYVLGILFFQFVFFKRNRRLQALS